MGHELRFAVGDPARSRRLIPLGFMEFGLYYPTLPAQLPVFQTITNEVSGEAGDDEQDGACR